MFFKNTKLKNWKTETGIENSVEWFKGKTIFSLNPFEMVHHNHVNKETTLLWCYNKTSWLKTGLFCSKNRVEERKEEWNTSGESWVCEREMHCRVLPALRAARNSRLHRSPHACQARSHTSYSFSIAFLRTDFRAKERLFIVYWGYHDQQCCSHRIYEPLEEWSCRWDVQGLRNWFSAWLSSQGRLSCLVFLTGCDQETTIFLSSVECLQFQSNTYVFVIAFSTIALKALKVPAYRLLKTNSNRMEVNEA